MLTARSADAVHDWLLSTLPPGWVWPRERGSNLAGVLRGAAAEIARMEAAAVALLRQVDPLRADALLGDYERVLGPDPCGTGIGVLPTALDRQRAARLRWTMQGGQSPAYFVAMAAALGVTIAIEEQRNLSIARRMRTGWRLRPRREGFVWRVRLAPVRVRRFRAGGSRTGHRLGAFAPSLIECVIRRYAPAHTVPVFDYSGLISPPGSSFDSELHTMDAEDVTMDAGGFALVQASMDSDLLTMDGDGHSFDGVI